MQVVNLKTWYFLTSSSELSLFSFRMEQTCTAPGLRLSALPGSCEDRHQGAGRGPLPSTGLRSSWPGFCMCLSHSENILGRGTGQGALPVIVNLECALLKWLCLSIAREEKDQKTQSPWSRDLGEHGWWSTCPWENRWGRITRSEVAQTMCWQPCDSNAQRLFASLILSFIRKARFPKSAYIQVLYSTSWWDNSSLPDRNTANDPEIKFQRKLWRGFQCQGIFLHVNLKAVQIKKCFWGLPGS